VADWNEKTATIEISKPKPRMPVKNRALYDVGTVGDTLCAEVLEVVLKVLDAECSERYAAGATGPRGYALYVVLYPDGARVMRYVLEVEKDVRHGL
jgi:hypothetical protein